VSPILVRPVREQLEHDRVIRLLQVRLKRHNDVTANIGEDQTASVKIGLLQIFPDLLLTSIDRGHKLMCTVEVETSESVNHLEARAQWAHLGKARAPFHLYVPASSVDIARRLANENHVNVAEIWSYHTIGDQTRFTLVHRSQAEGRRSSEAARLAAALTRPMDPKPIDTSLPGTVHTDKPARSARPAPEKKASAPAAPVKKRVAPQPRRAAKGAARKPVRRAAATAKKPAASQKRK